MLQEVMPRLEHIVFTSHDTLEFVHAIQFQSVVRSVLEVTQLSSPLSRWWMLRSVQLSSEGLRLLPAWSYEGSRAYKVDLSTR